MKKNYSDPLMFASRSILSGVPQKPSQTGTWSGDDDEDDGNKSVFINSLPVPTLQKVTIVNPVEEAVTSASTSATTGVTEESGEAFSEVTTTSSPLEVESVLEEIVPEATEEAATVGITTN